MAFRAHLSAEGAKGFSLEAYRKLLILFSVFLRAEGPYQFKPEPTRDGRTCTRAWRQTFGPPRKLGTRWPPDRGEDAVSVT
jgi:hypothetical protein